MSIGKLLMSTARTIFRRSPNYGKLIGKSKNGISVFEKTEKSGERIITSFKANGEKYKTITKGIKYEEQNLYSIDKGIKTKVVNHESGKITEISKGKYNYSDRQTQEVSKYYNSETYSVQPEYRFHNRYFRSTTNENGIKKPLIKEIKEKQQNGQYYRKFLSICGKDKSQELVVNNYKLPNGNVVSGTFGRKSYWSLLDNKMMHRNVYKGILSFPKSSDGITKTQKVFNTWAINPRCNPNAVGRGLQQYL